MRKTPGWLETLLALLVDTHGDRGGVGLLLARNGRWLQCGIVGITEEGLGGSVIAEDLETSVAGTGSGTRWGR